MVGNTAIINKLNKEYPMKKIIIISLVIATIAAAFYFSVHNKRKTSHHDNKKLHIAILTPISHPALQEVEQGFKETIGKTNHQDYVFTTFNGNGNKTLLRAQAEEIVNGNYDLIFTIGAASSELVAQLAHKKGVRTPQVFGAIDDQQFAKHIADTNAFTTGVFVKTNYKGSVDALHELKPSTKNMLLVYDPTQGIGLEKDKQEIEQYIKKYGISLHAVEIYQPNEIAQKVSALLPGNDVALVLIDNTVVAGIDALITLCNRYGVTLLVSDQGSGTKGAAIAYGITEYESGAGAAHKAHEILVDGKQPNQLPISAITNFRTVVNKEAAKMQNLNIDEKIIAELEK